MLQPRHSLAQMLSVTRKELGVGQLHLSRMLNMKLHRLSDLEKARSHASPSEDTRIRRKMRKILGEMRRHDLVKLAEE